MSQSQGQRVVIVKGSGSAATELAAFDSALLACGIGNYNLIRLSSVLPPFTQIKVQDRWEEDPEQWGYKLYVVYADYSAIQPGTQAWAGVGWVVLEENGAGLFVEHEAGTKQACRKMIELSLFEMCRNRGVRLQDYKHDMVLEGVTCVKEPVTAVVAAVYEAEKWSGAQNDCR